MANTWRKLQTLLTGLKGLSTIGSSHVVATLISTIFWFYIASLLGTEDYGMVSYFIAVASIAFVLSNLGGENTVIVYTAKDGKSQSSVFFISIISGIVMSIIIFFIFHDVGISLFVIGSIIFTFVISESLGRKLYKDFSKYIITQRILQVVLAIGLYYLIGIDGVILGFAISYFPYSIKLYRGLRESKIDLSIIKSRSGFILHSYADLLSKAFMINADKLIVLPLFGFALLGNYQLGVQFLFALSILPLTIYQYILPKEAKGEANTKLKIGTVMASIAFAFLGIMFAPQVLPFLFPQFNEAIEIIQIMSLAIIPISINYMYISKFLGMGKSKFVFIGAGIYVLVQILGILILAEIYGINGAALALVLGASSQAIFFFIANNSIKEHETKS